MRYTFALAAGLVLLLGLPVVSQEPDSSDYHIKIDQVLAGVRQRQGKTALYVTVQFQVRGVGDDKVVTELGPKETLIVEEDGRRVEEVELLQPRINALSAILALDLSGSMGSNRKFQEARTAAEVFLDRLDPRADCGLILFNHKLGVVEGPVGDPNRQAAHRARLREHLMSVQPLGGTAYLDATMKAVDMLKGIPGRKAVVVLTDGIDLNSSATLPEVIRKAQANDVRVFTVGVGEPGRQIPVSTVLVLDHSGSMAGRADAKDKVSKLEALQRAAGRFVDVMRSTAQTTLLPFSTRVERPGSFTSDKANLKARISRLEAEGGTLLYDAAFDALELLQAAAPEGKRAVVVLTDGMDETPGSRHRVEEVIARARETGIPLYMLGLGPAGELNEQVMRRMAEETGGQYYHSSNQQALFDVFESLSMELHDDGIDVGTLTELAQKTGGRYIPARDVSNLQEIYRSLAEELESTFTVIFPSRRSTHDGTARGIDILVDRGGVRVSKGGSADYTVRGVVVSEWDRPVYLGFLVLLLSLLAVPRGIKALYRHYGGK